MAQLTADGFRTAAYLEAKARLDRHHGKTRNKIVCNPPNKPCGNRCIPPAWDCRIKGEGADPHLSAVKTDPLGGIASIERGTMRLLKGVARGSFSDVEGGKKAIIRGTVKIVPGDLKQKKELQARLENRSRAIGIGLAVVTGGLSIHAILMKGNTFGYRDGLGRNINNAVRTGISNVLDAVPIYGAGRRAVRRQAAGDVTRAASRLGRTQVAGPVSLSEQLDIPTGNALNQVRTTTIAQRNIENAGKLTRTINETNTIARERNSNIYTWNEAHRQAFWNVKTKEQDIGNKEINIFAKPAAEDFLRSQYNIPPSADTSTALKEALQEQIRAERENYVSLARQQGFRIQRRNGREIIHPDDSPLFVRNLVRSTTGTGVMSRDMRNSIEDHVQSVLNQAPSTYTNRLYRDTVLGFDSFYNKVGGTFRNAAGVSSWSTEAVDARRTFNLNPQRSPSIPRRERDIIEAADEMRSRYMLNQMRGNGVSTQSIVGLGHSELTRVAYFSTRVNGTNNSTYSVTDRVAKAAASELAGRPVTSTTEAFTLLRTQYGFTGATEVRPASAAATPGAPRARETRGRRTQRNLTELARSIMARPGNENMDLATALRQARREQRGDSPEHDLPPRIRAFLEHRADLQEASRLGKPCGASHIPKAHECRKGLAPKESPTKEKKLTTKQITAVVVIGTVGALAVAAANDAYQLSHGMGMPATPGATSALKPFMKGKYAEVGPKGVQEAFAHYYDDITRKEGWKVGDLVYTRTRNEPTSHFAIYMGKVDGNHRFAQMGADGIIARSGMIDITEYGVNVDPKNRGGVIFQKAPTTSQPKSKYSPDDIARRISELSGKYLKYDMFSSNCETWARMIVSGESRSTQSERLTQVGRTAIRQVYKALGKVAELDPNWEPQSIPAEMMSAKEAARWLERNNPRGRDGGFMRWVSKVRTDADESNFFDLVDPSEVIAERMSDLEALSAVKRYLMVLSVMLHGPA